MAPLKLATSGGRLVAVPGVIRCRHLVSFSVQVREVREVVPFDDIGIFHIFP